MMMNSQCELATYFDKPDRSSNTEIQRDYKLFSKNDIVTQLLNGFPNLAVILNSNRQIVSYNHRALKILSPDKSGNIQGQRLGEAINCIHSTEMPAGCGTSKFCSECGAGKCNKYTRETLNSSSEECRIITKCNSLESSLDLRVFTSILNINKENFILFSIEDIKDEKRRKILEKTFFHDVLNTATVIDGFSEILKTTENKEDINEISGLLNNSSKQLISEIQTQRDLLYAEQGNLSLKIGLKSVNKILESTYNLYKNSRFAQNVDFICEYDDEDIYVETDNILLVRSLGNLVKNALEASEKEERVRIYILKKNETVTFCVQNQNVIPEQIQLQIFQRSFSTKASAGRGIGTYSVKLFVEQYLNGEVSFISNSVDRTIFSIKIPIKYSTTS